MKYANSMPAILGALLLFTGLAACGDDGSNPTTTTLGTFTFPSGSNTNDTNDPSNGVTSANPTEDATSNDPTEGATTQNPTTLTDATTNNPTSETDSTTNNPTSETDSTSDDPVTTNNPSTDTTDGDPAFVFAENPYSDYTQIDRHGAVEAGTAGIRASEGLGFGPGQNIDLRDDYNFSNPEEDASGMWIPEIADSVSFFHEALDDDLLSLGLDPATLDQSLQQAGPIIIPDTIKYDASKPSGFPNGRRLEDQVVDITLAAVLLAIGPGQPVTLFADVPLNPPENDVPFKNSFPFLAAPHQP